MNRDLGISTVIGEFLMIALVLILVPTITVSLMNQLPEDRIPTVTIKMSSLNSTGCIFLYHKGGDWVNKNDIHIFKNGVINDNWKQYYKNITFDLGDKILVPNIKEKDDISFVTKNSVIFSGEATYE